MYDGSCSWTTSTKCMDVSHDIMTSFLLFQCCSIKVNVREMSLHLRNLFICDVETEGLEISKYKGKERKRLYFKDVMSDEHD